MKLMYLLALPIAMGGCTLHGQQENQPRSASLNLLVVDPSGQKVDGDKARKMFDYFKDKKIKKDASFFVEFDRRELMAILQSSDQPTVKMLVGAYPDDDAPGKKQRPTILVQTAHSASATSKMSMQTLEYSYYEGSTLCPPPTPCVLEK